MRNSAICELVGREEAIRVLGREGQVVLTVQMKKRLGGG